MDLSSLATLGKMAGLGGIALGGVVLLVKPVIDRAGGVPVAQRASLLRFIAVGAFGIGALGIVAWLVSGLAGGGNVAVTAGQGGFAAGRDLSGNTVTMGAPPAQVPAAEVKPAGNEPGGTAVTAGQGGFAAGRDLSGNKITIGAPLAPGVPSTGPAPSAPAAGKSP